MEEYRQAVILQKVTKEYKLSRRLFTSLEEAKRYYSTRTEYKLIRLAGVTYKLPRVR